MLSLACCLATGGALLLTHQPHSAVRSDASPPQAQPEADPGSGSSRSSGPDGSDGARPSAAASLLRSLGTRLQRGTRAQVLSLGADQRARRELAVLRHNVHALGVSDLTMRYVDEPDGRPGSAQQELGEGVWVGAMRLRWRLRGLDAHQSQVEVPVVLREQGPHARFMTARRPSTGPVPLWLLDEVSVRRTARTLVVATSNSRAGRFSRLADRAADDVRMVFGRWPGRLVVEVPDGSAALARVLGSDPADYASIAALTTTVDGSVEPDAPVHIFVNPQVFDPLGPRGSQIVMSHEATHVATGAAFSSMPTWLLEGFADYVALAYVDLPVSVTASQILSTVRRVGAPTRLPGDAEFAPHNRSLGAAYESAWLACRLLRQTYGERRLVAFYRATDRDSSTTRSFRSVLGTDQRAFTEAWRGELRRLAG